jgi:hypothetical protein
MTKLVYKERFELYLREIAALQECREYSIAKSFIDNRTGAFVPTPAGVQILHGYGFVSIAIESCSPTLNDSARLHHAYSTILTTSN